MPKSHKPYPEAFKQRLVVDGATRTISTDRAVILDHEVTTRVA